MFKPHLKGSARLQGFTLRDQYFFPRALQGFSKASLSLFKPSSHGPCKVCMTESNLSLHCLCDPPREGSARLQSLWSNPFSRALQGFSKGPSCCSKILVKGYARVSLPSAFLQPLKPSQGLFSNTPGASTQQLRATSVSSAKSLLLFLTQLSLFSVLVL